MASGLVTAYLQVTSVDGGDDRLVEDPWVRLSLAMMLRLRPGIHKREGGTCTLKEAMEKLPLRSVAVLGLIAMNRCTVSFLQLICLFWAKISLSVVSQVFGKHVPKKGRECQRQPHPPR
jgi:hypothetical protein